MELHSILKNLYAPVDQQTPAMEKTAEAAMLADLTKKPAAPTRYEDMSLADLMKIAADLGVTGAQPVATLPVDLKVSEADALAKTAAAKAAEDEEMQKVAFDMLGGQVMAHAMVHELGLIKVAVANGKCRICKEHELDVEGESICSVCSAE